MKKITILFVFTFYLAGFAKAQVKCHQGDQNSPDDKNPVTSPVAGATPVGQEAYDPNELIGPEGYDSVRWVSINDVLRYTIMFENDPEFATAAAQVVDIRFNFPNKNMMRGFGIGDYSFANQAFTVPTPSNAYQTRIDLRDSLGYFVDLIGGLDVAQQQGFWHFATIDPQTGFGPIEVDKGMLPVNDSTHVGEGYVNFQLSPSEDMETGDTISLAANIVFDTNDTIPTNRWRVTIDAGAPSSRVSVLGGSPAEKQLSFEASDDEGGSGVKHLLLYMANNMGIYEEIDTVAVDSVLLFPVEAGKQYKLYSIAVDNVGNREPAKMEPDVILNFNQAPTDLALSDTLFRDDLVAGGFVGKLTSVDSEENKKFVYALAEGEGALHNDLFQITDDQLQIKNTFKCAEDSIFNIRLSTTDEGGLSYSKAFALRLERVLTKPSPDTLTVSICEGESCLFHGREYTESGFYTFTKGNDYMCDSVYVLDLSVLQPLEAPLVTMEGTYTLVSSAAKGNQWFNADGTPVEGATEQSFTPTEDGTYYVAVSNGSCFSAPSKLYRVSLTEPQDLTLSLQQGWNWVSSNLADATLQQTSSFLAPISEQADQFISQTKGMLKDPVLDWTGNLTVLSPQEGYKLHMTERQTHTWNGKVCRVEDAPLTLFKGWNWIGYVPSVSKDLQTALANLNASEGDVIKSFDDFATFDNGRWVGTLTKMKPGEGYMYQAGRAQTFLYPTTLNHVEEVGDAPSHIVASIHQPWNVVAHAYPDNMTVIGQVCYGDDKPAIAGLYTVGAFVNDECRGIGTYVEDKLFMTVHGAVGASETVRFKAIDNASGEEIGIAESCLFANIMQGSMAAPFKLHISGTTGINDMGYIFNIYPNPVRQKMFINGDTEHITSISVISNAGSLVLRTKDYPTEGIDMSAIADGIYVVVISTQEGDYTYKIIKNS